MSTAVEWCIDRLGLDSAAMDKGRRECIEAWKLISILSLQEEEEEYRILLWENFLVTRVPATQSLFLPTSAAAAAAALKEGGWMIRC
jgi:hypothetical protein